MAISPMQPSRKRNIKRYQKAIRGVQPTQKLTGRANALTRGRGKKVGLRRNTVGLTEQKPLTTLNQKYQQSIKQFQNAAPKAVLGGPKTAYKTPTVANPGGVAKTPRQAPASGQSFRPKLHKAIGANVAKRVKPTKY